MTLPDWQPLAEVKVPAKPDGLWTLVFDFIAGPRKLKFEASGNWKRDESNPAFGPDGSSKEGLDPSLLCPLAPAGVLIAKIGGGSADKPDSTAPLPSSWVFGVGQHCVLVLTSAQCGSLFLTMNDKAEKFGGHSGEISVKVFEAV